jgi:hypothetical protein
MDEFIEHTTKLCHIFLIYFPKKESVQPKKEHCQKDIFDLFNGNIMEAQINQFVTNTGNFSTLQRLLLWPW